MQLSDLCTYTYAIYWFQVTLKYWMHTTFFGNVLTLCSCKFIPSLVILLYFNILISYLVVLQYFLMPRTNRYTFTCYWTMVFTVLNYYCMLQEEYMNCILYFKCKQKIRNCITPNMLL